MIERNFMHRYIACIFAVWSSMAFIHPTRGDGTRLQFIKTTLRVAGRVESVVPADIDGDGRKDILVFWRQGYPPWTRNRVSIFRHTSGGVEAKPSQVLGFNQNTVAFDVGDVAGYSDGKLVQKPDNRADLVLLTSSGIWVHPGLAQGRLLHQADQMIKLMTIAAFPHREIIPQFSMLIKLDGRYSQGILIPSVPIGPLALYVLDPTEGWKFLQALRVPNLLNLYTSASDFRSMINYTAQFRFTYPRWIVADQNADNRADLLFFSEDELAVFRSKEDGSFSSLPDLHRSFKLILPKEHSQRGLIVRGDSGDINADNRADVVFYKTIGGISNMKSEIRVYVSDSGGQYPSNPDWSDKREGWGGSVRFSDVNGDKKADLIRPHVEMGISNLIGMMLKGKLDVEFDVHLASTSGNLKKKPDFTIESTLGINFRAAQELQGPYPTFDQDFTGDGLNDLLHGEMGAGSGNLPDRLEIRAGKSPFGYHDDACWHVDLPATHFVQPYQAQAHQSPGLIVYFPKVETHHGDVWVFANPKNTP